MTNQIEPEGVKKLSPYDWNIFSITHICIIPARHQHSRKNPFPWDEFTEIDRNVRKNVVPTLIETGFYERTKLCSFNLSIQLTSSWDQRTEVILFGGREEELTAIRRIHFEDYSFMGEEELIAFHSGIAAEAILAACEKYKLDETAARQLTEKYPVAKIEVLPTRFEPTLPLETPKDNSLDSPLSNTELAFETQYSRYSWWASAPFTQQVLDKIGPDTETVFLPAGLFPDEMVSIANAMLRAPKATLIIEEFDHDIFLPSDLNFLKYFINLRRIRLVFNHYSNLEGLKHLSPETIRLELIMRDEKPDLAPLSHFKRLQALLLEKHYEDLSKFSNLHTLRALAIISDSFTDLHTLTGLEQLKSLALVDCRVENLSPLTKIGRLQFLQLDKLSQLASIDEIAELKDLEYLIITNLNKLEKLPSFKSLKRLRKVALCSNRNLVDLAPLAEAPNLEHLSIYDMKKITQANVDCFNSHPTLKLFDSDCKDVSLPDTKCPIWSRPFEFSSL